MTLSEAKPCGVLLCAGLPVFMVGAGVLRSGIVGRGFGWTGVVGGGALVLGFLGLSGGPFAPPFLAHVYTFALGVNVLRGFKP